LPDTRLSTTLVSRPARARMRATASVRMTAVGLCRDAAIPRAWLGGNDAGLCLTAESARP
jgi:hypothetical protein